MNLPVHLFKKSLCYLTIFSDYAVSMCTGNITEHQKTL